MRCLKGVALGILMIPAVVCAEDGYKVEFGAGLGSFQFDGDIDVDQSLISAEMFMGEVLSGKYPYAEADFVNPTSSVAVAIGESTYSYPGISDFTLSQQALGGEFYFLDSTYAIGVMLTSSTWDSPFANQDGDGDGFEVYGLIRPNESLGFAIGYGEESMDYDDGDKESEKEYKVGAKSLFQIENDKFASAELKYTRSNEDNFGLKESASDVNVYLDYYLSKTSSVGFDALFTRHDDKDRSADTYELNATVFLTPSFWISPVITRSIAMNEGGSDYKGFSLLAAARF